MKRKFILVALSLGLLASQQALAQSDIGFKRGGVAVGYVSPEDLDGTFGIGVFADLGTITPEIALEPRIDYWSTSEEAFGSEVSIRDIAVGARAKYFFQTSNPKLRPFAGAGLGLHFLNAEVSVSVPGFPTITEEESSTKLGLDFGGGISTPLSPQVDLLGELWYGIVSDASQFSLRAGLSYKFGS
jgi:opacity protein-like surface antigen